MTKSRIAKYTNGPLTYTSGHGYTVTSKPAAKQDYTSAYVVAFLGLIAVVACIMFVFA